MDSRPYEQSRRLAALAGGGLLAAASLVAFVYQLPATFFPFLGGPPWLEWIAFAILYMAYATASLPFDIWAGYWLPCRHQRECQLLPVYLGALFRSEAVQFAAMTLSALAMLEAGQRWGAAGALAAMAAAQGLLVALRPRVARVLGAPEQGPLPWHAWLPGFAWNLAGMALMLTLPWCAAGTVYQLVQALLGCSFWSLAGYWLLRGRRPAAALALLYQSWACFGLFSRATASLLGVPQLWAAGRAGRQEPVRKPRAASQISSTWSRSS
ncbi:MAG: hypothetical protein NZR01_06650 [Bryobacteraceae bacterium]|nr:hypothetical protein [Bryobacteraceae bacterium]